MKSIIRSLAFGAGLLPLASAAAQGDARWAPFVGCWAPVDGGAVISLSGNASSSNVVCVTRSAGTSMLVTSIANGRVVSRERVDATNTSAPKTVDSCDGMETATWSGDGHRLMFRSELRCKDGVVRKESGVFAISSAGEWVDVQGIDVMGSTGVRVLRFRDAGLDSATVRFAGSVAAVGDTVVLNAGLSAGYALSTLRTAAASALSPEDVLDVSRHVDPAVAEAWLTESGQSFTVDARSLVKLADAGMTPRMIDMIVALSYPKTFAVAKNTGDRGFANGSRGGAIGYGPFGAAVGPIGWGMMGSCLGYGSSYGSRYRTRDLYGRSYFGDDCNYGYNSLGYNVNGYGYGYGNNVYGQNVYYGTQPVVIVPRDELTTPRGRAVAGKGYTRRDPDITRNAPDMGSDRGATRSSGPSTGAGTTSGTGGSAGGSSGGSTGRTAKPRGGTN